MQPNPNFNRRRDILLLILSSIGILGLLIRSATLAVTGILTFDPGYGSSLAASVLGALGMLFCAGLLLPVLVYSIKRLKGQEILPATIRPVKFWQVAVLVAAWVLVVIIGAVLASLFAYGWAVAAPLFLLGISLPILSLAWIGAGGLPGGSRRRLWSVYGFGMVGGTVAAMLLEYLVIGMAAVVIGVLAVANPELRTVIDQIKTQVANANAGDIQALLTVLAPYLTNPLVILSILVFAAVLAPLIEEAVKPAVIWFLGKRLRFPAEGFVLGALCGAGFAMMEGLMAASGATQMWGFGLAGRAAASLMHITSSGLLGWAIASAQLEKRYGRLALTYLLSVSIHGLWNGSAIMAVYGALRVMTQNMQIDFLGALFVLGGLGMLLLELVLLLTALPLINRRLRRSAAPPRA
ncbi:MAG: PrsW family glutamic-type intramembrane protease [Anaerolineales bacterium]|nr:PrsW family glutamic-type intramembrane protease [Anaerolineales bacterium]